MESRAHRKAELSNKHWNAALAREVLADFAASGMSLTAFARSMGVNLQRLDQRRLFLPVSVRPFASGGVVASRLTDAAGRG